MDLKLKRIICDNCGSSDIIRDGVVRPGMVKTCPHCGESFVVVDLVGESDNDENAQDESLFKVQNLKLTGYDTSGGSKMNIPKSLGVMSVEERAFENQLDITSVKFPSNLRSIGERAFSGCYNLNSVSFPPSLEVMMRECFMFCERLMWAQLPAQIKAVPERAFAFCKNLNYVELPSGVTNISAGAFAGCGLLSDINFYGGSGVSSELKEIGQDAFMYCQSLSEIELSSSLVTIGSSAFSYCSSLEKVVIPKSVTKIGDRAFAGCRRLREVFIPFGVESLGKGVFSGCHSNLKIKCAATKAPSGWDRDWSGCEAKPLWGARD
ncbi:MAG: leucine-rich repeat protein [Clostridia bacterium]|nr:leucine-rich repeat protein [Clostridia bacterium]